MPGFQCLRKKLWVHPRYVEVASAINVLMQRGSSQFHLLGTAGCGKSAFGVIWLVRLASQGKRVLFRAKDEKTWVFFDFSGSGEMLVRTSESQMSFQHLVDEATWLIVDGASAPVLHPGPILQCTSDTRQNHEFAKSGKRQYMGAWTFEECEAAVAACGLDIKDLSQRFYYVGGVPRLLFDPTVPTSALRSVIDNAFATLAMSGTLEVALNNPAPAPGMVSDKLFHYGYSDDHLDVDQASVPATPILVPGSEYILSMADQTLKLLSAEEADKWIRHAAGFPGAEGWRGRRYEKRAQDKLERGGTFLLKDLDTGTVADFHISQPDQSRSIDNWELMHFSATLQDVNFPALKRIKMAQLSTNAFVRAVVPNQKSWDSFRIFGGVNRLEVHIYQVTVANKHPVKSDSLKDLMDWVKEVIFPGHQVSFKLVFVVPEDKFPAFQKKQPFLEKLTIGGYTIYTIEPVSAVHLPQYVMQV